MKVLKPGRIQKGWAKDFTCTGSGNDGGGCGATLLVEEGDLFSTRSSCAGEVTTYVTFECASCGVWTDLKTADVPTRVWGTLPIRSPSSRGQRRETSDK